MPNAFRTAALALPRTIEQPHFGAPSFRVEGKIFAQLSADETRGLVKLPPGIQEWAVAEHPEACSIEPQWGRYGWTRLVLAAVPAEVARDLLQTSWRAVTPRKLHCLLIDTQEPEPKE